MAHIVMILRGDIRYDGRVRKEIATLSREGHRVELVVSDFNKTGCGGEGISADIHYVPTTLRRSAIGNFAEVLCFNRKAASLTRQIAPAYIHCHDLNSLPAGVWAKKRIKATLIFDAHELFPESMGGIRKMIWNRIERSCVSSCDYIVMPEEHRIAYFKRKYPLIVRPVLLQNLPRKSEIPGGKLDLFRNIYPIGKDQTIILYTGLVAPKRHVEELIEATKICGDGFVLVILGRAFKGYENSLRGKIAALDLESKVFLHAPVPHTDILRYMASCDIGTAFYGKSTLNNYYCASNKVFEYIALEKPIVTNNYPGLLNVVERFGQGICLEQVTARDLAAAFGRVMDRRTVKPGTRKYFWEDEEDALIQLYGKGASS